MVESVKYKQFGELDIKLERKTIGKRLVITNFVILIISLITFLSFVLIVIRSESLNSESEDLIRENEGFFINLSSDINKVPPVVTSLSNGRYFHIWYYDIESTPEKHNEDFGNRVIILQRNGASRDFLSDLMLERKLEDLSSQPQKITVNEQLYLAVASSSIKQENGDEFKLVTLVPYEEILGFDTKIIFSFILLVIILAIVSGTVMYIQSRNITKPIKKLMNTTKSYSNRDFSESLVLDTGDEIEDLSKSVQKMVNQLKEYEKSQISLFRNLSHELKTPLTAISGYAEGIELGRFEDTTAPLKIIQEESIRIKNILEDLIFLSKIESHSEVYSKKKVNIVDTIIKSLEKVESIAIMNDVDLEFEPCGAIEIICDEDKIVRAFINVLSNSLKYGKDNIKVDIIDEKAEVTIVFKDNGDGFACDVLEKLLSKPFDTTLDGNGLGLMIVKEIISAHFGSVNIGNDVNNGAVITIKLPK